MQPESEPSTIAPDRIVSERRAEAVAPPPQPFPASREWGPRYRRRYPAAGLLFTWLVLAAPALAADRGLTYPPASRGDVVDDYHGTRVADPYRWMEDIDSPQTRAWVEAEAKLGQSYLAALPERGRVEATLRRLWNYERWSPPEKHGHRWFFAHNDGLQNQSVLFVADDPAAKPSVLLDPNTLSADGTVAVRETAISDDGRYLAYALSEAGSDWQTWHVRDLDAGSDLPDTITWSKFGSASWRKDDTGFYYAAYDPPKPGEALKAASQYQKLLFHRLGTSQSEDRVVYARREAPDWYVGGQVTDDGHYLVITANLGTDVRNTLLVQDLTKPDAPIVPVIPEPVASAAFIGNIGTTLYVQTDQSAPLSRIVAIDLFHPDPAAWHTVVPEGADTLQATSLVGGQLIAQYLQDAHSAVRRFGTDGKPLGEVPLPGLGSSHGFAGEIKDTETYFSFGSYTTPPSVYRLDLKSGAAALWHAPSLAGFASAEFETRQVFTKSKDGTRVPIFVTARKGTKLDGSNPTILYGYGGFNIPIEPDFSPAIATWLELGGVYAVATLRGGGEYGRAWHEAGMKTHKQNVFDDFIAAAEYLIDQRWTDRRHLAIYGRSNGGLLIGAVEEQRPDLFAAAVPQVGVMDMLRFRDFTAGKGWESDYGSVDDPDMLNSILAYSPYENVRAGVDYPPTLVVTGDHDDRVYPAHSFKFAAAMQHADPHGNPIVLRVDLRAGHGSGKPTAKQIEEVADIYAFMLNAMASPHGGGAEGKSAP
ncbi:MAG TPA: prolyl oligopeptidase family serine peptidase [Stellaceae bacterium]|nr:prolyl oligopeptidase family serine peptidase [Stellaceae bacterium]